MNAFDAQCILCRHAKRRGTLPIGCERFADPDETQAVLNFVLYRLARSGRCGPRELFDAPADAYMAQDDPKAERTGDAILRALRLSKKS